jgi:hypothetical protein
MCASYFALPSASVSTRTTVPPGTFAWATAVTFARASRLSGVSSLRCLPHGRPLPGGGAGADAAGAATLLEPELPPAALAMP